MTPGAPNLPDTPENTARLLECGRDLDVGDEPRDAWRVLHTASAMATRLGDRRSLAAALVRAGHMSRRLGDALRAEREIRQSIEISEAIGDKDLLSQGYTALGSLRTMQARPQEAVEFHRRSLEISEEIGDRLGVAIGFNNVGSALRAMGDYSAALDQLERSADAFEQLGDRRRSATVLNNIGLLAQRLGDYPRAFDMESRALAIFESFKDRAGIAKSLDSLAGYYRVQGDYAAALRALSRALELRMADGAVHAIAESLNNIGDVYAAQGNDTQAVAYLQRAIEANRKAGSKSLVAEIHQHLGELHFMRGDDTRALASLQQSLTLSEAGDFKAQAAATRIAIARLYARQGRLTAAADALSRAIGWAGPAGERSIRAEALIELAECERRLGRVDRGLADVADAKQLADALDIPELQWRADTALGRLENAAGRRVQARRAFDAAIATVEDLRSRIAADEPARSRFLADRLEPYRERLALALGESRAGDAFYIAEQTKSRALLDAIGGDRVPGTRSMTPAEQHRELELKAAVASLNAQVLTSSQSPAIDPPRLAGLRRRRDAARLAYEDFQAILYASHPELQIARGHVQVLRAAEAETLFASRSTAILEFALDARGISAFVIRRGALTAVRLSGSVDRLKARVRRFRDQMSGRDLRAAGTSRILYDRLLRPLAHLLQGTTELIIIPDDVLWEVPFQALQSAPNHYLIEDTAVSYAPSATVLRETLKRKRSASGPMLLAFGNPTIGADAHERRQVVLTDEGLPPLPEAEAQVKRIGALYGATARVYTGSDAREDRWKSEAPQYRVLHLATHGVLDNRSPLYSFVALAPSTAGNQDDGLLEAREIMDMRLNADLVVLSACDTARGSISPGEGVIGLMWAFFVAGSPATLVTQWKVEAASSTELMVAFHRQWNGGRNGLSKTEALRKASIELLHSAAYSHPFYWAGYILAGDPR